MASDAPAPHATAIAPSSLFPLEEIPAAARAAVLRESLAAPADVAGIAARHDLTVDEVRRIRAAYGYPNTHRTQWAIDRLTPPSRPTLVKESPMTTPIRDTRLDATSVLDEALASATPAVARKATRLQEQIQALAAALEQARETEARNARIAELKAELAELQGTTKTPRSPATGEGAARAWARERGMAVPNVGRVPAAILKAYRQDQASHAA